MFEKISRLKENFKEQLEKAQSAERWKNCGSPFWEKAAV